MQVHSTKLKPDIQTIRRTWELLTEPGDVHEARSIGPGFKGGKETRNGYFDDGDKFAHELAAPYKGNHYLTINPVIAPMLAKRANRIDSAAAGDATGDQHIARRRHLLIDIDPKRPSGISATDAEKAIAFDRAAAVKSFLDARGWPAPIEADSGNGPHLLYRIDLPNDDDATNLVRRVLVALADVFSDEEADVDTSVFNASRISKVYGTIATKGDNIPERLHRLSKLITVPDEIEVVTREQLESLAGPEPEAAPRTARSGNGQHFDFDSFIEQLDVKCDGPYTNANGATRRVKLNVCPLCGNSDGSAVVLQYSDGRLGFKCHHNSCNGRGWSDLREHFEPGYQQRRAERESGSKYAGKAYDPATNQVVDVDEEKEPKKSQATLLVEIANDCELFHDPSGDAFVRFPVGDHFEVSPVRNRSFRRWLARQFYEAHEKTPSAQALVDCMSVLEGMAVFSGPEHEVHIRTAEHEAAIYVDLCDPDWKVVKITTDGWEVISNPPVMFRRAKAQLALPTPIAGGSLEALRQYINVTDEEWPLALAWLVQAIRPEGPYPALSIYGEQGSAKSTTARFLRMVIDPNTAPLRCEPREPRDLMIAASNSFIPALDNLSHISTWLSDALCRMATGGGFSTRTLYENDEETIFDCQRPIIMTAIEEVATRGDLLDRCIILNLPRIPEEERRPESEIEEEFKRDHPAILGALLTAVSTAMRRLPSVKLDRLPRMADFAIWATAAEPALGLADGEFLQAYCANRAAGNETALESSPVGKAVMTFVQSSLAWSGTCSELLAELENVADDRTKRLKSWPATARALGAAVKRLAPNLRATGIGVEFSRAGKQRARLITLTTCESTGDFASASSATSATPKKQAKQADAKADAKSEADANGHEEADAKSGGGRKADANANGHCPPETPEKQGENGKADAKHMADANLPPLSHVGVADSPMADTWRVE